MVTEVVHRRGHRTIHVIFLDDGAAEKEHVMAHLKELGATYEGAHSSLYALDLKPEIDFDTVADYLEECQNKGWLDQRFAAQPQPKGTGDLLN